MNEKTPTKNTVRKIIPIRDVRSPYFCVWLQEMSEQGLLFKTTRLGGVVFEKSMPQKRRYRPIYKSLYKMEEDERAIYEDAGWQLMFLNTKLTIATTDDNNAPDLFNDDDSYRRSIRHKWVGYTGMCICWLFCIYVYSRIALEGTNIGHYASLVGELHAKNNNGAYQVKLVYFGAMCLVYLIYLISDLCTMRFFLNNKRPNYEISFQEPRYLREKKLNVLVLTAIVVLFLSLIPYAMSIGAYDNTYYKEGEAALKYDGEHPVRFSEFDPDTWKEKKKYLGDDTEQDEDIVYIYSIECERGKYIKNSSCEELDEETLMDDDYRTNLSYSSYYGEADDTEIAIEWIGEEATHDVYGKVKGYDIAKVLDEIKIDCDGVDYAGYVTTPRRDVDKYDYQRLYLRKGDKIQIVTYAGSINLKSKHDVFVDEFE